MCWACWACTECTLQLRASHAPTCTNIHTPAPSLTPPQVLVEAELGDGERCSVLLQNAETVRMVGPAAADSASSTSTSTSASASAEDGYVWQQGGARAGSSSGGSGGGGGQQPSWRAISVSDLAVGDRLFVLRQGGARHTGVAIEESITER